MRLLSVSNWALCSPAHYFRQCGNLMSGFKKRGRGVTKPLKEKNNSERKRVERDLLSGRMCG